MYTYSSIIVFYLYCHLIIQQVSQILCVSRPSGLGLVRRCDSVAGSLSVPALGHCAQSTKRSAGDDALGDAVFVSHWDTVRLCCWKMRMETQER